jgi:2-keto-3-deoxy-L-rhamnonate aldolase RhmA
MVTLAAPETAEILAQCGFDWLFLDAEHGTFGAREIQAVLQAVGPRLPCVVRVEAAAEVPIKKALDVGAAGIIAPQVNTSHVAEQVVQYAKYSPDGARGVGLGRAHGYGFSFTQYVSTANEHLAVIVQAEHMDAVENIESIVRVPGVDAVLVGPYDLSASLGRMGEVDHPDVVRAIDRVTGVCQSVGMTLGIFGVSAESVRPYLDNGYTLVVAGVDSVMLGQAARQIVSELK